MGGAGEAELRVCMWRGGVAFQQKLMLLMTFIVAFRSLLSFTNVDVSLQPGNLLCQCAKIQT